MDLTMFFIGFMIMFPIGYIVGDVVWHIFFEDDVQLEEDW